MLPSCVTTCEEGPAVLRLGDSSCTFPSLAQLPVFHPLNVRRREVSPRVPHCECFCLPNLALILADTSLVSVDEWPLPPSWGPELSLSDGGRVRIPWSAAVLHDSGFTSGLTCFSSLCRTSVFLGQFLVLMTRFREMLCGLSPGARAPARPRVADRLWKKSREW